MPADQHAWCEVPVPPLPQLDGPFYLTVESVLFDNLVADQHMLIHCDLGQASVFDTATGGPSTVVAGLRNQSQPIQRGRVYCHRRSPNNNVLIGARYTSNGLVPSSVNRFTMIITIEPV